MLVRYFFDIGRICPTKLSYIRYEADNGKIETIFGIRNKYPYLYLISKFFDILKNISK